MKLKTAIPSIAAALLAASPFASAQNATTDPVGFTSYTVRANSDQRLGLPLQQASVFTGMAASVNGTTVTATGLSPLSGSLFLVVTSGSANGIWESVSSSSNGSLTLASSIVGFSANNTFVVKPFWTLSSLFPNGGGVPASPDVYEPRGFLFLYSPSSTGTNLTPSNSYLYHDGSERTAGWYDANDPDSGLKNSVLISPEVFLAVRNSTGSNATVTYVGSVPTTRFSLDVVRRSSGTQDNLVYNKFPADVTLGDSGLASSGAVASSPDVYEPTDFLFFFTLNNSGFNPAASSAYIYHDGSERAAGWYNANDPDSGVQNSVIIPAGSPLVIRKQSGASSVVSWNPAVPY
jgi:uncharacterized protein (TIGR02597 family)